MLTNTSKPTKIKLTIELLHVCVEYLKWFKTQDRPELTGYNDRVWFLQHTGVLITTDMNKDGEHTDATYIVPTEIGRQILQKI